jgi:TRAP-type mannitol/chloroaromatic compound transport system permease small subunit
MAKLTKWLDDLSVWVMRWARWNAVLIMLLINYEVIMRYGFNAPTIWGGDMLTMISGFGRMVGVGYAQLVRAHVIMDIFTSKLSFKKALVSDILNHVVFIIPLLTALIYATTLRTIKSWAFKETMYSQWRPPVYPLNTLLVGCYLLLGLQGISEVIKDVISLQKGSKEWLKDR